MELVGFGRVHVDKVVVVQSRVHGYPVMDSPLPLLEHGD